MDVPNSNINWAADNPGGRFTWFYSGSWGQHNDRLRLGRQFQVQNIYTSQTFSLTGVTDIVQYIFELVGMTKTESLPNANETPNDIFPGTLLQDKFKIIELLQNSSNSSRLLLSVMMQEAKQFSSAAALISTPPRLSLKLDRSVVSHYFILMWHSVEICFLSRGSGHMLLNLTGRLALPSEKQKSVSFSFACSERSKFGMV